MVAVEEIFLNGEQGLVSVSEVEDNPILIRVVNDNGILTPFA